MGQCQKHSTGRGDVRNFATQEMIIFGSFKCFVSSQFAYVKDQNSYLKMAFKSVKYHLTVWSKAINEKISHLHP